MQKLFVVWAHLFIGIVAYQLVHGIREELNKKNIHSDRRHIRNIMSSQTPVTTRMQLENRDSLIIRQPSRPNHYAAEIYSALKFRQSNKSMRKKSVVPIIEIAEMYINDYKIVTSERLPNWVNYE